MRNEKGNTEMSNIECRMLNAEVEYKEMRK